MERTTRREALGTLGGLLAALALALLPGASASAALSRPSPPAAPPAPREGGQPAARPPQHSVRRHG